MLYLLMGQAGIGGGPVPSSLRGVVAATLQARGASRVQVNVLDAEIGTSFAAPQDPDLPQLEAVISWWVDSAARTELSRVLPAVEGGDWHGYLVCESEPLANTTSPAGPDGRVPGFAQFVPLARPPRLSWGEWRQLWQGDHTSVALHTQSTFRYVQNVVLRPLTLGAPAYAAIVEECFPTDAAKDLHVYFDAVGDDAKLTRHMSAMSDSCDRFMDGIAAIAWTAEYLL